MNREEIIGVLDSWNFWKNDPETGIDRPEYLERINRLAKTGQVVAITGVRRSGKSTIIKQFIKNQIRAGARPTSFLFVNFEEPRFADGLSLEFLQSIYDAYLEIVKPEGKPWVLLDEVQKVPKWESFVRALHEKGEAHVLVSGSTSDLLSSEFGTLLTGRWVEQKVYPLSFHEFLRFRGLNVGEKLDVINKKRKIKQLLREYLEFGGFPLVTLRGEKEEILRRYFEDITLRDIAARHNIRKTEKLKGLAKYYLTNFSSMISYRKVSKFIGVSLDSIERFSEYLKDTQLVFFIPKFSFSLKEQEINPRKVYGIDSGLINIVSFRFSENIGRLFENAVFLSLVRQNSELYYYKGAGECDFIVKQGKKVTRAIQVSYTLDGIKEREIKGLLGAMEAFKLKTGFVVTEDMAGEEIVDGKKIVYVPLWRWLLESQNP
ncbi:MAG: ATP-binding protein [Candidatus Woesearchaeota archaeon]